MSDGGHRLALALGPALLRDALAAWFTDRPGWCLVGSVAQAEQAADLVLVNSPQVLLLGLDVPAMTGLQAAREVRGAVPTCELVMLAERHNEAYPPQVFEAGARGYVTADSPPEKLETALLAARRGDYHLALEQGGERLHHYVGSAISRQRPGGVMTPRERQMACLLADGYSSKEAAAVLNISVRTADTHRASLMRKLGARNVADVVRYCIRNRLIQV